MKEKQGFYSKEIFLLTNISHLFLEDNTYKKASFCLFQSLGIIVLIMTMYPNRQRKVLEANYKLLKSILKSVGKVRGICATHTGSRLDGAFPH